MARSRWFAIGCTASVTAMMFLASGAEAAGTSSSPSPPQLVTITIPAPVGEIPSQWLSYSGPPRADVLLPAGYNAHKRYPLLVLLGGLGGNYASYASGGEASQFDGLDAIVVMPEGGSGWYTDWWNDGERDSPGWESYELDEVIPTILARYPILPQRRYHAIAGTSMGGLGAVYLAGRLPGFFGSVASLSGLDDLQYLNPLTQPAMGLTSLAPSNGDFDEDPVDGPPSGFYFKGHNPPSLTMNLQQTRVFESTGDGLPSSGGLSTALSGGLDSVLDGGLGSVLEGTLEESLILYPMNQLYHAALTAAGIDVTYQVHSGGHDDPDFDNEIKAMLAWGLFRPVTDDSTSWVNDTVATSGRLWDVGYSFAQPPSEVVQFRQSGSSLSISAAGSPVTVTFSGGCVVTTPTPATVLIPSGRCR
jgi:S-formylglutathione hydrolase FrmB